MQDDYGAFTDDDVQVAGAPGGSLAGLAFGAKDLYDVAGFVTGAGSPDWARTHGPAERSAPAVQALLDAGATLVGKTHTDELAYSLLGMNGHYGTPVNPRAPGRVPGGSSSGSATAVAAGLVPFALGSDTGGSVRVPASNQGILGIRPTHGSIPLDGVVPLAPSFDVAGWFAQDPALFARLGDVLLGAGDPGWRPARLVLPSDAWGLADPDVRTSLEDAARRVVHALGVPASHDELAHDGLEAWASAFRVLQAREIWRTHRAWVEATQPTFGPGVRERFAWAASLSDDDEAAARPVGEAAVLALDELFGDDGLVVLPAAPTPAPRLDSTPDELEDYRTRTMQLTCPAGLAGLPQVSVPLGEAGGCPVALSLLGPRGRDHALLALAGIALAS
ncbi:MAG: amidase [Thermoleophilia bacterium]